jgi:hypothetical protein
MKKLLKLSIAGLVCLGSVNVVTASDKNLPGLNDNNADNPHVVLRMQPGTPTPEVDFSQPSSSASSPTTAQTPTVTVIPIPGTPTPEVDFSQPSSSASSPTTAQTPTATVIPIPGTPTPEVDLSEPGSSAYSTTSAQTPTSTVIPMEEPVVEENSIKKYFEKKSRNGKTYYLFQTEIDKDANTLADKNGKYAGKSAPHWKNYLKKGERVTINEVKWDGKVKEEYFTTDISNWEFKDFFDAYAGRNVDKGRLNSATVGHLISTKQTDALVAGAAKNLLNDLQKITEKLTQGNNPQNQ